MAYGSFGSNHLYMAQLNRLRSCMPCHLFLGYFFLENGTGFSVQVARCYISINNRTTTGFQISYYANNGDAYTWISGVIDGLLGAGLVILVVVPAYTVIWLRKQLPNTLRI